MSYRIADRWTISESALLIGRIMRGFTVREARPSAKSGNAAANHLHHMGLTVAGLRGARQPVAHQPVTHQPVTQASIRDCPTPPTDRYPSGR